MCVGVTVTLAPPTALACGYYLWHSGQSFALTYGGSVPINEQGDNDNKRFRYDIRTPPPQSFLSYTAGIITLSGMYLSQDRLIQQWEAGCSKTANNAASSSPQQHPHQTTPTNSKYFLPHKAPHQAFRPPQTVQELMERLGPPLLSRLGAASLSFFCAGVVQTYVAGSLQSMSMTS